MSPDDIDLLAIAAAVRKRARLLVLGAIGAAAITFGFVALMPSKYASQTQIEIVSKGLGNPFEGRRDAPSADMISVRMDKEAIGTHVRALLSTDLALKVAKALGLAKSPEFNNALPDPHAAGRLLQIVGLAGPRAGESEDERVLRAFAEGLRVYQIKDTRGIVIEFRSEDPALAADIVNKLAEIYRDDLALRTVQETEDARTKLGPQIRKLAEEVAEAEADVTRFRGQANIFDAGRERSGLNEQQLGDLTSELTRAATARAEAAARAREAREIAQRGGGETLPDVQKSALVQRLVEQRVRVERQIAELSATLLPAHPRMKQLNADLAGLNRQIKVEVGNVVDSLEREVKVAALREEGVRQRIEEAKKQVVNSGADDVRLRALESLAKSKRAEFERLQRQLEEARTTADARAVPIEVQIVSRGRPPSEAVAPRPALVSLLAALAVLLVGLALVVSREILGARRTSQAAASGFGSPGRLRARFGVMPDGRPAAAAPISSSRSVSSIARHLAAQARGRTGFRILVAGETPGVPTSKPASDLARQLAVQGRQTILLDWTLDAPPSAEEHDGKPKLGLTDVLSGRATFEDVVERLPYSAAHAIGAGSGAADKAAAGDPDRINMLLDALDEAYDHIVIAGDYGSLRALFSTMEGRVDAGIVVADTDLGEKAGNFLGFQVADLPVIRYEPVKMQTSASELVAAAGAAS
jgi:uncharacterized protein involved in exopolysaccharide biosynthesis